MSLPEFSHSYGIIEAIVGLAAWDGGAGCGIRDDTLKGKVIRYLASLDDKQYQRLRALVARSFLDDKSLDQGYGMDSVIEIDGWIEEQKSEGDRWAEREVPE